MQLMPKTADALGVQNVFDPYAKYYGWKSLFKPDA